MKYKVVEASYYGNPVEDLEAELNKLGAEGWRVVAATTVRELGADDKVVNANVPVVVLEHAD